MKLPENTPSTIGVYVFIKDRTPIYIGKAVNLRARVKSHFEAAKLNAKEEAITQGADKIKIIKTPTEFQALVLESWLIQRHRPKYNVIWKDDKSYLYIKVGDVIKVVRKRDAHGTNVFGPFASSREAENILRSIRRVVPFHSSDNVKRPCFYSKIGLCDSCPTSSKNVNKIVKILSGKVEPVLRELRKDMKKASEKQDYETALIIRNKIKNFERLISQTFSDETSGSDKAKEALMKLLKLRKLTRIECYDISNLNQREATASMVVWRRGIVDKSQYRKFKVKNEKRKGDVIMLDEILKRRFRHKEWPRPDLNLIVVDGGKPQVRVFMRITKIPVVGIAKNPDRLVIGKHGLPTLRLPLSHPGFNLIRHLRDESHRFAKKYHLGLRAKNYLS